MTAQNGRTMPVTLGQCMETRTRIEDEIEQKLDRRSGFYRWVVGGIIGALVTLSIFAISSYGSTKERLSMLETAGGGREDRLNEIRVKVDKIYDLVLMQSKKERGE